MLQRLAGSHKGRSRSDVWRAIRGARFFCVVAKVLGHALAAAQDIVRLEASLGAVGRPLRALVTPNSPHLIAVVESVSRTGGAAMPLAYWNIAKAVFWIVIRGWSADPPLMLTLRSIKMTSLHLRCSPADLIVKISLRKLATLCDAASKSIRQFRPGT
jgi:hypothetical protein